MRLEPRTLVALWRLAKEKAIDVFRPGAVEALRGSDAWTALQTDVEGVGGLPLITNMLRALALLDLELSDARTSRGNLVATLPVHFAGIPGTSDAVRDLLEGARRSIMICGYELREPGICRLLRRRGCDGIPVTVVADRDKGSAREMLRDWPASAAPLKALENVEAGHASTSAMHAKLVIVDEACGLLGSANFTAGGLHGNIEFGVRITGKPVADILEILAKLERGGWLVPARP